MHNNKYQILILGGGITGSSLLYTLSLDKKYKKIALIEKSDSVGGLNTSALRNSQTLHFGDIETNYTLAKAKKVKADAEMVADFLEKSINNDGLFERTHSMILAVGQAEVEKLSARYEEFKEIFPELKKLNREEIQKIEPNLIASRSKSEPVLALMSEKRYTVNYQKLSERFAAEAKTNKSDVDIFFNTTIKKIEKKENGYLITTNQGNFETEVLAVTLGAHSLYFAKQLGYGLEFSILPIIGDYYSTNHPMLNGKVYTMQNEKLPFAAIHGDPNILDKNETRFGPTALSLPILERGSMRTFFEFLKSSGFDLDALLSIIKINSDKDIIKFVLKNLVYTLPIIGRIAFTKDIRKIVPKIKVSDLKKEKGVGGIRPQLVNKKDKKLLMGAAEILGDRAIFSVTPSPGATACLATAARLKNEIDKFL